MMAERPNAGGLQTSANIGNEAAPAAGAGGMVERLAAAIFGIAPLVIDIAALGALGWGCFLAWKPLGFIVPGAAVFALSIFADLRISAASRRAGETKP